ncbi:MAG: hypothetical protein GY788_04180 [bacterium]|nr:hypothetical protein [bacterium]
MKTRLFVLLLALGLIAAACGGSDESDTGVASLDVTDTTVTGDIGTEDEGAVDAEQAMLDLAACLRDNGVEIEDPTVDASGNVQFGGFRGATAADAAEIDREAFRAAMDQCQEILEGVALGFGGRGDIDVTELQDTMVEYAACMRDNGYDMDDPDLTSLGPGSGGEARAGGGGGPFGDIDRDDPDFVAAQEVCGDILGGLPGGGLGRRGGGNG